MTFTLGGSSRPIRERDARLAKVSHSRYYEDCPSTATCWNLQPLFPANSAAWPPVTVLMDLILGLLGCCFPCAQERFGVP